LTTPKRCDVLRAERYPLDDFHDAHGRTLAWKQACLFLNPRLIDAIACLQPSRKLFA
jgi:hypothetical protein